MRAPLQRRSLAVLAVLVAVALGATWALQSMGGGAVDVGRTQVYRAVVEDPGAPRLAPEGADVTVVVFTDYRCPVCRASEPALQSRIARDGKVRVIYKDWPILGEASRRAARVALAAHRQGRYVAMHDALMRAPGPLDDPGLRRAADAAGVDWTRLRADLATHGREIDAVLARNAFQAWSLGIEGTPAYLVGTRLLQGKLTAWRLDRNLAAARRQASSSMSQ